MTGDVWAVLRVKDEVDVLGFTLEHLRVQKLDGIFVIDNGSTDGTAETISRFHERCMSGPIESWGPGSGNPWVMMADDPEVAYYQAAKMTGAAEFLHDLNGAKWIIPVDADELWVTRGTPLGDYFRALPDSVDCVEFNLYNHFPTSGDAGYQLNPFLRIAGRDPEPAPLPKVAIRWQSGMAIHQGNHGADGPVARVRPDCAEVRHFPWRSFEQFEKKVRNGAAAYAAAADLPEEMGAHWRGHGRILEEHGVEALRTEVWAKWFFDPPIELVDDPAPYAAWS